MPLCLAVFEPRGHALLKFAWADDDRVDCGRLIASRGCRCANEHRDRNRKSKTCFRHRYDSRKASVTLVAYKTATDIVDNCHVHCRRQDVDKVQSECPDCGLYPRQITARNVTFGVFPIIEPLGIFSCGTVPSKIKAPPLRSRPKIGRFPNEPAKLQSSSL